MQDTDAKVTDVTKATQSAPQTPAPSATKDSRVIGTQTETAAGPFFDVSLKDSLDTVVGLANAWPLALLIALLVLRKELTKLVGRIARWSGYGVDVEFREGLDKLTEIAEDTVVTTIPGSLTVHEPEAIADTRERPEAVSADPSNEIGKDSVDVVESTTEQQPPDQNEDRAARIMRLAQVSPAAAVIEAYADLEQKAKIVATAFRLPRYSPLDVVSRLVRLGKLPEASIEYVKELRTLRNRAAHQPKQLTSSDESIEYWKLASDLGDQLSAILASYPGSYKIVYKGGPDHGFIDSGPNANRLVQGLGLTQVKGEDLFVIAEPRIGRGFQHMSRRFQDAVINQRLTPEECMKIWQRAGIDIDEMLHMNKYLIDEVADGIIIMKFAEPEGGSSGSSIIEAGPNGGGAATIDTGEPKMDKKTPAG
jgi:hypothetical protein